MDETSVPQSPAAPLDAQATLTWMTAHGPLLRELIGDESPGEEPAPASDPAIRAHLRFLAEALAATISEPFAEELDGLSDILAIRFDEDRYLFEAHVETGAGAIALEQHLQHRTTPGSDPSLDAGHDRRVRITGWIQLFLLVLEERLGPRADGLGVAVSAEIDAHNRDLARLIVTLDQAAKRSLRERLPQPPSTAMLDEVGQIAVVQAHVRLLVESLATVLRRTA